MYVIDKNVGMMHFPKTGGIWARSVIRNAGKQFIKVDQHGITQVKGIESFMFIRNPITWISSFYAYHERTGWQNFDHSPVFLLYACRVRTRSFEAFVDRYLEKMPGAISKLFMLYMQKVRYVGYTENLQENLVDIMLRFGYNIEEAAKRTPQKNVSPSLPELGTKQMQALWNAEEEFITYFYLKVEQAGNVLLREKIPERLFGV